MQKIGKVSEKYWRKSNNDINFRFNETYSKIVSWKSCSKILERCRRHEN